MRGARRRPAQSAVRADRIAIGSQKSRVCVAWCPRGGPGRVRPGRRRGAVPIYKKTKPHDTITLYLVVVVGIHISLAGILFRRFHVQHCTLLRNLAHSPPRRVPRRRRCGVRRVHPHWGGAWRWTAHLTREPTRGRTQRSRAVCSERASLPARLRHADATPAGGRTPHCGGHAPEWCLRCGARSRSTNPA